MKKKGYCNIDVNKFSMWKRDGMWKRERRNCFKRRRCFRRTGCIEMAELGSGFKVSAHH